MLEIGSVNRINAAEHHRMDLLKARQRLQSRVALVRQGVANLDLGRRLDVRDEIPDVTRFELRLSQRLRRKDADFLDFVMIGGPHQLYRLTCDQASRKYSRVGDDPAVNIEYRIKDERPQFPVR